jgi:hypothetical protein
MAPGQKAFSGSGSLRSSGIQTPVPEVSADQLTLDRTLKQLRKLRWIGKELDAQKLLQVLDRKAAVITSKRSVQVKPLGRTAFRERSDLS